MKRLLITARDASAALHLVEIVKAGTERDNLEILVAAQPPAIRYFEIAGHTVLPVDLQPAKIQDSPEGVHLLAKADEILADVSPDCVLCGLSSPFDGGIDEAVLARFHGPSFVMQDFWGEANAFFGKAADMYLALDEEAVRLSRDRHGVDAAVIGSPRHSAYQSMNMEAERIAARRRLGVEENVTVIGYFGQALHALPGYGRTLRAWAEAVRSFPQPCLAVYRPHPRESELERRMTEKILEDMGVRLHRCGERDVEHALLSCDVACSSFSNCTYDAAYLNYYAKHPLLTPMSLFFDEEIVAYFRKIVRLSEFPYLKSGLVEVVRNKEDLSASLRFAAALATKEKYWNASKQLQNPAAAPRRALDMVAAARG